jgi:Tfp pilus assembly protein PilV
MRKRDRGAALVEGAISMVLLGVLVTGIIEYGYAWRQATVVEKAVQQGARLGASAADDPLSDYTALQALRTTLASADSTALQQVVVYRSSTPAGGIPDPQCLTTSVAGVCNRYVASDLARPSSQFGCAGSAPDRFWCPTGRERDRRPRPDYLGVHVRVRYAGMTGLIPAGRVLDRSAVYALEPCAFGLPGC